MSTAKKLKVVVMAGIALLMTGPVSVQAAWPVRFTDGTVVEVVGIAENSDSVTQWWSPDGSDAKDPRFQSSGSMSGGGKPGSKPLQLIIKTSGPAMTGKNLVVRVEPDFEESLLKMKDARGEMIQIFAPAPSDKPSFNVRFGLASGPWKDSVLWDRTRASATQSADAPLQVISVTEEDGQAVVRLKTQHASNSAANNGKPTDQSSPPVNKRLPRRIQSSGGSSGGSRGFPGGPGGPGGGIGGHMDGKSGMEDMPGGSMLDDLMFSGSPQDQKISVISHGKKIHPAGYEGGDDSLTLRFRCPKSLVDKVIVSSRAYEWMEMQNVSSQPGGDPTKVNVVPVKEPASESIKKPEGTNPPITEKAP